jgi:hypothetical protein
MPTPPAAARAGRVRAARITDLAAVGELSRMAHPALSDGHVVDGPDDRAGHGRSERDERPLRSLGLPVTASHVSVFSLFRMPLGAFQPHDQLYVYEEQGRLAGLARVERDTDRDEWTVVELDAVDHGDAGDIRFRLVQHLVRDGSRRGAARFHVACADRGGNVEIFMQAGFARYGEETILYRDPATRFPAYRGSEAEANAIRPANAQDALELLRLYRRATPAPVARLEGYRLPDWEHLAGRSSVPRTSLTPILRFADVEAYVQEGSGHGGRSLVAMLQLGVAKEQQPHYMRVLTLPDHDPDALIRFGLAVIGKRSGAGRPSAERSHQHGVMSCVRTYEAPLDRRFEEQGMATIASVSLLIKEALVRVEEPSLVPAV